MSEASYIIGALVVVLITTNVLGAFFTVRRILARRSQRPEAFRLNEMGGIVRGGSNIKEVLGDHGKKLVAEEGFEPPTHGL